MNPILRLSGPDADVYAGASIDAAQRQLTRKFRLRGLDAPGLDARIIVGHVLGFDRTALAAHSIDESLVSPTPAPAPPAKPPSGAQPIKHESPNAKQPACNPSCVCTTAGKRP